MSLLLLIGQNIAELKRKVEEYGKDNEEMIKGFKTKQQVGANFDKLKKCTFIYLRHSTCSRDRR